VAFLSQVQLCAVLTYRVLHGDAPRIWGRSPLSSSQSPGSAVGCHQSLGCGAIRQTVRLSAAELFRLPPPGSGILYRSTSSRQQHFSLSRNTWKRSYCNDRTH